MGSSQRLAMTARCLILVMFVFLTHILSLPRGYHGSPLPLPATYPPQPSTSPPTTESTPPPPKPDLRAAVVQYSEEVQPVPLLATYQPELPQPSTYLPQPLASPPATESTHPPATPDPGAAEVQFVENAEAGTVVQVRTIDYGESGPLCHNVERIEAVDQCEQFVEQTCYTQNTEHCELEFYKNCTGVVVTNVERACFTVEGLLCSLQEHINYDTVEETYKVTKCSKVNDRICDTVFDSKTMTKNEYSDKQMVCDQQPTSRCYDVPRTMQEEKCTEEVHKYCQKFTNVFVVPLERQNCHFATKKFCEIQDRVRAKKAKRFSYSVDCKSVNRELCDNVERMTLDPKCEIQERMKCSYSPVMKCEEEPRQYCHMVENVIVEKVCEKNMETSYL